MTEPETTSSNRRLIRGTWATSSVLVAVALAIVANLVASQLTLRVDMTQDKIYTLNAASTKAVAALPEPVTVKVFISPDMPPPLHTLSQSVGDLLSEYAAASGGKMTYEIISPKDDAGIEETAKGYGCEKVALGQQNENEVSLRAVYKCVAFVMGEQQQVIRDLRVTGDPSTDNLEYDITKALLNLGSTEPRRIGFVAGFGGPAGDPKFSEQLAPIFEQLYGRLIIPVPVDLGGESPDPIPESVHAIVLMNPDQPFTPQARFAIDHFVQRGGSVGWMQGSMGVNEELRQQLMNQMPGRQVPEIRRAVDPQLNELFEVYGVRVEPGMVLDRANALTFGMVMTEQGVAQVSHPATFQINDMDRALPFLVSLPPLALPAPTQVTVTEAARANKALTIHDAIRTDDTAVRRLDPPTTMVYSELLQPEPGELPGPFLLAATVEGDVPSYYDKNPLPPGKTEADLHKGPGAARLLVIGSGDFFQPNPTLGFDDRLAGIGQQLFFNALEWLAQDSALAQVRGKKMPRFVGEVPADLRRRIQTTNILFVPLCFIGIGTLMWLRRRKRRRDLTL
jgi:ABC-2 type transport system permease protein